MPTQREHAQQMISQLRLLDPSISGEVGTPERKIIDTVAQALYDNQIDLDALSAGLDLDTKYGTQLDRFLSIFGFARQKALFATGFVTFSRPTPSNADIRIPTASLVAAAASEDDANPIDIQFQTVYDVILPAGTTSVVAPIRAILPGSAGNVAAERIQRIVGSTFIYGITAVTNEVATSGGRDSESDEEFKVRFKNTVFRNLAGTRDQYMALAVATAFTTKANVIGPQSHWREYIQVPPVADNAAYDVDVNSGLGTSEAGNGNAGEYTSALSLVPFAKYIYSTEFPVFVSNGQSGIGSVFYRQDVDFALNNTAATRNRGDAFRLFTVGLDSDPLTVSNRPSVTFKNVYTGADADVQAIRPGDLVLMEFGYLSSASRNDVGNRIMNAVDVYIDGGNEALATTILTRPNTLSLFVDDPTSKFHYENYRRIGDAARRPLIGNVLMPLMWQPVMTVPAEIIVGTTTYFRDVHYWAVEDVSEIGGTVRARSGIEWSTTVKGKASTDVTTDPAAYTGKIITDAAGDPTGGQAIEITEYTYDKNVIDLQAALEGSKQVTTDVLAHKAKTRYAKLDVTVMYSEGYTIPSVNESIREAVDAQLRSQFFGTAVQLSDLLQVIHNVPGVDNVRWTADTPGSLASTPRIYETARDGQPLLGVTVSRAQFGSAGTPEIQKLFLGGQPTGGQFKLAWNGNTSADIAYNASAAAIETALDAIPGNPGVTVTEDTRSTTGVRYPIRSFTVTWVSNGARPLISYVSGTTPLRGGNFIISNDFFLLDDEQIRLASAAHTPVVGIADTVAGLIIRPRAQNTWPRSQ